MITQRLTRSVPNHSAFRKRNRLRGFKRTRPPERYESLSRCLGPRPVEERLADFQDSLNLRVPVRLDHVASRIVNANHSIMCAAVTRS